jgi:hypothetical protein
MKGGIGVNENSSVGQLNKAATLKLTYPGHAPVNVHGPFTGQLYQFSRLHPVQTVDARDAMSILKTRLFRQAR